MELTQDKINLIEKIIRNDKKFERNEDLYDDFFNETCKRSLSVVTAVNSEAALESYIRKIATTSIINVLKDSGRLRRTKKSFVNTNETYLDTSEQNHVIDYSNAKISYRSVEIKNNPEDIVIKKEILKKVVDTVYSIENEEPEKQYLYLFNMRYQKGMTQKEIAENLGLSQSEVSKRLMKLMDKVKQAFN